MTITATTTDESILANVQHAKDRLAILAATAVEDEHFVGEQLVRAAQQVRNAEELARVQLQYRNVLRNKPKNALPFLLDVLARGADDTWSGRDNESKRSAFDAVTSWVRNVSSGS